MVFNKHTYGQNSIIHWFDRLIQILPWDFPLLVFVPISIRLRASKPTPMTTTLPVSVGFVFVPTASSYVIWHVHLLSIVHVTGITSPAMKPVCFDRSFLLLFAWVRFAFYLTAWLDTDGLRNPLSSLPHLSARKWSAMISNNGNSIMLAIQKLVCKFAT